MAQRLNPFSGRQFLDSNGDPYVGAQLFSYVTSATGTGGTTKITLTKDAAGVSNHENPIILNARGEPSDGAGGASMEMWQAAGTYVKLVLAPADDTDPPTSAISSWDNLGGINDASISIDQWISGPAPTYISATSFSMAGDQTTDFHIGRRVKTENTGGTIYSTIISSAYTSLTTITVVNDSGVLDSGLSAVSYGLLSAENPSISTEGFIPILGPDIASAAALPYPAYGNYSDVTGTTTITSLDTSGEIGTVIKRHFDGALILTHHATDLILPGGANITTAAGDEFEFTEYASGDWRCTGYTLASGEPIAVSPTAAQGASMALLSTATASNDATIDIDANIDSTYDEYRVQLINIVPASDATNLYLHVSTDGGSSYVSTGTDYRWIINGEDDVASLIARSNGDSDIRLCDDIGNQTAEGLSGWLKIFIPSNSASYTRMKGDFASTTGVLRITTISAAAAYNVITAVDAIRFIMATGNITSGTFRLWGIKNS